MVLAWFFILAVTIAAASEDRRKPFTLEETYRARYTGTSDVNARWLTGNVIEYRDLSTGHVMSYDAKSDKEEILLDSSILSKYDSNWYRFSSDGKYVLIGYDNGTKVDPSQPWLPLSRYVVYSLRTKSFTDLDEQSYIQHAEWVPRHNWILYIKNNNIYKLDLNQMHKTYAITENGLPGVVYNGLTDQLYKEEIFHRPQTISHSFDGDDNVYVELDESDVKEEILQKYGLPGSIVNQYSSYSIFKYSKPGAPIPKFKVWYYNSTDDSEKLITIGGKGKEIVAGVEFVSGTVIQVAFMNRFQNETTWELCSLTKTQNGNACREVADDKNSRGWNNIQTLKFSKEGDRYLKLARVKVDKTEFYHVQIILKDGTTTDLSPGKFMARSIVGWDEKKRIVYFRSPAPGEHSTIHVYAVNENGKDKPYCMTCDLKVPEKVPCKSGTLEFSPDFHFFLGICLGPSPLIASVYENVIPVQEPLQHVEQNIPVRELLKRRLEPKIMNLKVPVADSMEAEVRLMLPPAMDTSGKTKYPLIIYVYGGPDFHQIQDSFTIDWRLYLTTNRSIIYGIIDGRGTGQKGTDMLYTVYKALGTVEIQDQISVTENITNTFSFIDKSKVGVWGWSYGGYATSKILENDDKGVFKCGIAQSPVTDWLYYNAFYTERYMDLPSTNPEGYRKSSTLYNVENLRKKRFLLSHGTGDPNVLQQHNLHLAKVLQKNNILFEHAMYTDQSHSVDDFRLHLFYTFDHFFERCFGLSYRN